MLLLIVALAIIVVAWIIRRATRRRPKPVVVSDADLRVLQADIAGEMRDTASSTLFGHFARDLTGTGLEPRIAVIRFPELVGVEDETGEVDLPEPDEVELSKARRGEDADLLVWGRARLDDGTLTLRFAAAEATVDTGNPTQFAPSSLTVPYAELSLGPGAILTTAVLGSVANIARERGLTLRPILRPLVERLHAVTRGEARDLPEQCRYDALRALAWGWLTLGFETDDTDALARAADTYKEILRFDRPERDGRADAELHLNFAAASLAVGEARDDSTAMENAAAAAENALLAFDKNSDGPSWAFLQNRLGRALSWLGVQEDDTAKLAEAIDAQRRALEVWQLETVPALWASTQHSLGDALAELGRRSVGTASLELAAAVYRETLRCTSPADGFIERIVLRRELARVLTDLGTRLGQQERHEEAIQSLERLEKPVDPNATPVSDPEIKRALGRAWLALANCTRDPLDMAKAARALKAASAMRPDGEMNVEWGETYRDLGLGLLALGTRRRRRPLLRDAVGAFRTALDGLSMDETPAAWTDVQRHLADAHLKLARLGDGKPEADAALEAYDRILAAYSDDTDPHLVGLAHEGQGDAHLIKARTAEDDSTEELDKALVAYRAGLELVEKARSPLLWARLQSKLADALAFWGGHTGETARLEEAADAYRASLEVWTPAAAPEERARVLAGLGHALADLSGRTGGREAAGAFEEASQLYLSRGAEGLAANTEWSLRHPKPTAGGDGKKLRRAAFAKLTQPSPRETILDKGKTPPPPPPPSKLEADAPEPSAVAQSDSKVSMPAISARSEEKPASPSAPAKSEGKAAEQSTPAKPEGETAEQSSPAKSEGKASDASKPAKPEAKSSEPSATAQPEDKTSKPSAPAKPDAKGSGPDPSAKSGAKTSAPSASAKPQSKLSRPETSAKSEASEQSVSLKSEGKSSGPNASKASAGKSSKSEETAKSDDKPETEKAV